MSDEGRLPAVPGRRPAAVVFDCDGVLVDSEALSWSIWAEALAERGYTVTDADAAASLGRRLADLHTHFAERIDLPPLEQFVEEMTTRTVTRFAAELEPFADAVALARALAAEGVPLAVASSSAAPRLAAALRIADLDDGTFAVVVSGEQVPEGKPAPDLYLAAAAQLGVDPVACVAIEDSPRGVASAKAAGMRVLAVVRGHVDAGELAGADVIADTLDRASWETVCRAASC